MSFAALSLLVQFWYLYFLQSFSDRKEYISPAEEKVFKKKKAKQKKKKKKPPSPGLIHPRADSR